MTPRKDSDFYKLKHVHEKLCYLNGMPKEYLMGPEKELSFVNFKCNSRVISSTQQKKTYDQFKENWGSSNTAFFLAHPHDRDALTASCQVIRKHAQNGFKSFEFISPFEDLRFTKGDDHEVRELYILLGANDKDEEMTKRIRRWIRQPHGASVWVVGVSQDPYRWASETLGCVPTYMFWLKRAGLSVG